MTLKSLWPLVGIILVSMGIYHGGQLKLAARSASQLATPLALADPSPRLVGAPRPLTLGALSFLSLYLSPGGQSEVLVSRAADQTFPIASVTKLMTALLVFENYDPNLVVTIEPADLNSVPDPALFQPGQRFTVEQLSRSLLIESSNWSAEALARLADTPVFVSAMNQRAAQLNLAATGFSNSSGLDTDLSRSLNHSSAYDLASLARTILTERPEIFAITRQAQAPLTTATGHFHHLVLNTNKLLATDFARAEIVGGKTGQTDLAKKNLLLVLQDKTTGGYLINVVLGADDNFRSMKELVNWVYQNYEF